jgi:hypothetical protein
VGSFMVHWDLRVWASHTYSNPKKNRKGLKLITTFRRLAFFIFLGIFYW